MKAEFRKTPLGRIRNGLVSVFLMQGERPPREIVQFMKGLSKKSFEGKLEQTFSTETLGRAGFRHLLVVGLGEKSKFRLDNLRRAAGLAVHHAASLKEKELCIHLPSLPKTDINKTAQAVTEGAILAAYKFDRFKSEKKDIFKVEKASIASEKNAAEGVRLGVIYANAQNYAREVDEQPANIATPNAMAKEARKLAKEKKLGITVYDKRALERMGMKAILAVAKGSTEPPVLVRLEYNKGKSYPLYCVVGKGITFDSGGISLKPSRDMHEMKYDKSGAIDVLGVMKAVAELKLPIRLIGLMPLAENVPSGSAQLPGDIIKAYNGKTIEVLNTDAEGRLVLADALSLAAEQKPKAIIDMATLTGAIIVSLGRHAIGLFSNDDKLSKVVGEAGDSTHERVWRLPLWSEYSEMMKSDLADLKNIPEPYEAGSITAAAFLQEFVGDTKWAHLDIAGVGLMKRSHPYLDKGAAGIGVRLVTETLVRLSKKK